MDAAPLDQVAQELGISRDTVYRLIKRHGLSTYRQVGDRRTWIDRDEIRPLVGLQRKQASSDGAGSSLPAKPTPTRRARAPRT